MRVSILMCSVMLMATLAAELPASESSGVRPKEMAKPSRIAEIATRSGQVHWRGGVIFSGPKYVAVEDGDRTIVNIIVTRKNTSDTDIELCGLFSFVAVAQFGVESVPENIASAVLPQNHDCQLVILKPGEAVHDSLTYSFVGADPEGRVRLHCVYYELEPDGEVLEPLDLGGFFVPFD